MKYFIVSDVHGFYDEMIKTLNDSGFDPSNDNHILVSLGDNFDRGPKSVLVLNYLLDLYDKNKAILVRGNHEDLLCDLLNRGCPWSHDVHNGTLLTVYQFSEAFTQEKRTMVEVVDQMPHLCHIIKKNHDFPRFIKAMINYYEIGNFILTHGFIPVLNASNEPKYDPNWKKASTKKWEEARFLNGMMMVSEKMIRIPDKTFIVGHYNCSYGNVRKKFGFNLHKDMANELEFSSIKFFEPYIDEGIVAIDSCVHATKKINCYVIEED